MFPFEIHIPLKIKKDKKINLGIRKQENIKLKIKQMFPLEIRIPLKIKELQKIALNIKIKDNIVLKISEGGGGVYPVYTGETEVEPKTVPQTLETKNKSVLSDINVLKIPYFETSNIKGTTVIIGGNG